MLQMPQPRYYVKECFLYKKAALMYQGGLNI
jgi:hypothetical protein